MNTNNMSEAQFITLYGSIGARKNKTTEDYSAASKTRYARARKGVQDFIDRQELKDAGNCDLINYDLS